MVKERFVLHRKKAQLYVDSQKSLELLALAYQSIDLVLCAFLEKDETSEHQFG